MHLVCGAIRQNVYQILLGKSKIRKQDKCNIKKLIMLKEKNNV
jgi:hypothetical protein